MSDLPAYVAPGAGGQREQPSWKEVQHFRQWWLWLGILAIATFMWVGLVRQIVQGHPYGSKPMSDSVLLIFTALFGLGFPAFFLVLRLVTEVYPGRLRVGLAPFRRRVIPLSQIVTAEAITYHPILEYGGWGVRWAGSRGVAYNASGNRGVQLVLVDGRKILVGSRRPEELVSALQAAGARASRNAHGPAGAL